MRFFFGLEAPSPPITEPILASASSLNGFSLMSNSGLLRLRFFLAGRLVFADWLDFLPANFLSVVDRLPAVFRFFAPAGLRGLGSLATSCRESSAAATSFLTSSREIFR